MASEKLNILDLGCGRRKRSGAIGIDSNPRSDADVFHDLNQFPYPFSDGKFDEVYADNILEHLDDVIKVMTELHRITKSNGTIFVTVPFYPHRNANTDPTHKHWFGVHSFDYFVEGTDHGEFRYTATHFKLKSVEFDKGLMKNHWFDRIMVQFANRRKDFYEHRFANIFPLAQLTFELNVVKE
ncbi:MAG: methyltransferase domain-containing protein [Bacteroidota bacterium]|nr:methyltransferase domain-containing protein [Bacteroidota bacterium]